MGLNDPEGCCVRHFVVWSRSQNTVTGPLISSTWETHTRAHRHTYTHTYTQSESGSARFSEACLIFPVYPLSRVLLSHCPGENEGSGQRRERRKYPSVGRGRCYSTAFSGPGQLHPLVLFVVILSNLHEQLATDERGCIFIIIWLLEFRQMELYCLY